MEDVLRTKWPNKVHSKEERVTSEFLEYLKTLSPKLQKKEWFKRKLRYRKW